MEIFEFDKQLAKTFVKDFDIPLYVIDEPTFFYQLEMYGFIEKWKSFVDAVNSFPGNIIEVQKEAFYNSRQHVEDEIINEIKNSEAYKNFNDNVLPKEFTVPVSFPSDKLSEKMGNEKVYLSIDLKSANIQALHYFDKDITFGENTWDGVVHKVNGHNSMSDYIISSKHVRQVVMGMLNPKRAVTIEKHMMGLIYKLMVDNGYDFMIESFNNDEIVFDISDEDFVYLSLEESEKIVSLIREQLGFDVHLKIFSTRAFRLLNKRNNDITQQFILRIYDDGKTQVKGVPGYLYGIVFKLLRDMTITSSDRHFINDNMDCMIVDDFFLVDNDKNQIDLSDLV